MDFRENLSYLKYFGLELTFWKVINKIFADKNKFKRLSWEIHDINNDKIEKYLRHVCPKTYDKLINGEYDSIDRVKVIDSKLHNNVIWTMWWQGEENAPDIVKMCINSMRKHNKGHQVIVIDAFNYQEYVQLPQIIFQRFEEHKKDKTILRKISLDQTQISDIIRTFLLYYYGGIWADATIFFSNDIDEDFFEKEWITLGQDNNWYIGRGRWSTFFMGAQAGLGFIKFNYDMHIEYWKNKKYYVNYLMTDHMFDLAYKERKAIKDLLQNNPCVYKKCLTINRKYNQIVDEKEAKEFFEKQVIHKLSWKWWGREKETKIKIENNDITWFSYLVKYYGEN